MNMPITKKNIFLTGAPSSGKTTVIKKVIRNLPVPANGFYTEEEKIGHKRVGFLMRSLDGKEGYLAHQDIASDFCIRRYGVSIENIETLAVPSILPVDDNIIILDDRTRKLLILIQRKPFLKRAAGKIEYVKLYRNDFRLTYNHFIRFVDFLKTGGNMITLKKLIHSGCYRVIHTAFVVKRRFIGFDGDIQIIGKVHT